MSVELNELHESARQVIANTELPAAAESTWQKIVELGWLLVAVPEELDGLDSGIQGACTMHLELGRKLSGAPYLPAMLAIDALCNAQLNDKDIWLERAISGELITTALATMDVRLDDDTLNGSATAIQSADSASHILIWTVHRDLLVLVGREQAGVKIIEKSTWDTTRRLFDLKLQDVPLAGQTVLARGPEAAALIDRLSAQRDFALAVDAIGGAGALLERTVEHLQDRVQFRRPLAMFQALKHRCADMKAGIAAAEAMLFDALARFENELGTEEASLAGKAAKLLATSTYVQVAEEGLQLHGGIGMANEHPCHLFVKRSLLSEHLGGDNERYADAIASKLVKNFTG